MRLYATIAEVFRTGNIALLDPLLAPDMVDHAAPSGPVIGREPGKQLGEWGLLDVVSRIPANEELDRTCVEKGLA